MERRLRWRPFAVAQLHSYTSVQLHAVHHKTKADGAWYALHGAVWRASRVVAGCKRGCRYRYRSCGYGTLSSGCVTCALLKRMPEGLMKRSYLGGRLVKFSPTKVALVIMRFHILFFRLPERSTLNTSESAMDCTAPPDDEHSVKSAVGQRSRRVRICGRRRRIRRRPLPAKQNTWERRTASLRLATCAADGGPPRPPTRTPLG